MSNSPEVSIIIPTLRAGKDLVHALGSIAADKKAPSHEVLVVFNTTTSVDMDVEIFHPHARAVQSMTNLGFAEACNLGAREASGRILAFMNDDMEVRSGWLANLLSCMNEHGSDAAGGRILTHDGKRIDFAGSSMNLLGWGFQAEHGEHVDEDEFIAHQELPFACGGNMAIKTEVFLSAGGFDPAYFAFFEDVDLGWRLRILGHDITYAHDAVTLHAGGATGSLLPPALKWFLQERNALQSIVKNYEESTLWRILPFAFAMAAVRAQVLSDLRMDDLSHDRTWKEWISKQVFAGEPEVPEYTGIHLLESFKDSIKAGLKASRKHALSSGFLPLENRGAASLLAVEWVLVHWDELVESRKKIQTRRKRSDKEIIPLFNEPLRPVLGHPRETAAMAPLEDLLSEILSE